MKKILLAFFVLFLSSCSLFHIHRMDIEQGNQITSQSASQIHKGMSKGEVVEILGTPVLINTFRDNRSDYVYTYHKANGPTSERSLTLMFRGDVLVDMQSNTYAEYLK